MTSISRVSICIHTSWSSLSLILKPPFWLWMWGKGLGKESFEGTHLSELGLLLDKHSANDSYFTIATLMVSPSLIIPQWIFVTSIILWYPLLLSTYFQLPSLQSGKEERVSYFWYQFKILLNFLCSIYYLNLMGISLTVLTIPRTLLFLYCLLTTNPWDPFVVTAIAWKKCFHRSNDNNNIGVAALKVSRYVSHPDYYMSEDNWKCFIGVEKQQLMGYIHGNKGA